MPVAARCDDYLDLVPYLPVVVLDAARPGLSDIADTRHVGRGCNPSSGSIMPRARRMASVPPSLACQVTTGGELVQPGRGVPPREAPVAVFRVRHGIQEIRTQPLLAAAAQHILDIIGALW